MPKNYVILAGILFAKTEEIKDGNKTTVIYQPQKRNVRNRHMANVMNHMASRGVLKNFLKSLKPENWQSAWD